MTQDTINKLGLATKIFGAVLFVACLGALVWSLFQPAVTTGPMPDPFQHQQQSK